MEAILINLLIRNKLAVVCAAFIFAMYMTAHAACQVKIAVILACTTLATVSFALSYRRKFPKIENVNTLKRSRPLKGSKTLIIAVSIAVIAASLLTLWAFDVKYNRIKQLEGESKQIEAVVSEVISSTVYSGHYIIDLKNIDGEKINAKMKFEADDGYLQLGDVIETNVTFAALSKDIDGFSEERYYLAKNVMMNAIMDEDAGIVLNGTSLGILDYVTAFRNRLSAFLNVQLNRKDNGLISALLLGDKRNLSDSLSRDFTRLGISHMVAISGMHIAVLMEFAGVILSRTKLHRKTRNAVIIALTVGYVALAGFSPSVMRAGIMVIIRKTFEMLGYTSDPFSSLFFSVALICACNPFAVYDVGLILSFAAALVLIAFLPVYQNSKFAKWFSVPIDRINRTARVKSKIKKSVLSFVSGTCFVFAVSILVSLFTLPILWLHFGKFSLVSPLANVIFNPFFTVLLYFSPLILLFMAVPAVSSVFAGAVLGICRIITDISSEIAKLPMIYVSINYRFTYLFVFAIFALIATVLLMYSQKAKKRAVPVILLVLSVCAFVVYVISARYSVYDNVTTVYLNYKQNDGFVIVHKGKTLICDISDGSYSIARKGVYEAENLAQCDVDVLMLTHYHQRHKATLNRLTNRVYVRELWLPEPVSETDIDVYGAIIMMAEEKNIRCHTYEKNQIADIDFIGVTVKVNEYSNLKRSAHPVISLSFTDTISGNSIAYIGASAYDITGTQGEFVREIASSARAVVFGAHGPIYKTYYSYDLSKSLATVVFSGETSEVYADASNVKFHAKLSSVRNVRLSDKHRIIFEN